MRNRKKEITEEEKQEIGAITWIILGTLMFLVSGWLLIFVFDVIQAPGLIRHFPEVYIFLFSVFLASIYIFVRGVINLRKVRNS